MQPLKPFFLGLEEPPAPRLTTVQKVFRTRRTSTRSGSTAYHLTFFEMLGNFSFGDYFKDGAVDFAWEFVTGELKLDPERLWVERLRRRPGARARRGRGRDRRLEAGRHPAASGSCALPRADNFWPVGGPGPCGPCSEIFYDRGRGRRLRPPRLPPGLRAATASSSSGTSSSWSTTSHADGSLTPLPKQNIDTGMGLERTAR